MMSEHPDVGEYLTDLSLLLTKESRIYEMAVLEMADTPISMCRNRAVIEARKANADLLLMIDSDMCPDCELSEDPEAKPFWQTSFDFIDAHWDKQPMMVAAPYGGPAPCHNVYVFDWTNKRNDGHETDMQLDQFSRHEAALQTGIKPVGALPTGLILTDMRLFDVIDPKKRFLELRNLGLSAAEAMAACPKWFDYEWSDIYGSEKASTEDVFATRNLSLASIAKYGANSIHCNWDAWAAHWKPEKVRKPRTLTADRVSQTYRDVVLRGTQTGEKVMAVDFRQFRDSAVEHSLKRNGEKAHA